uniref:Uncharacterized protein n=1 Tax=Xenopus tropicalis TaxID=8364 RepID=A0A803KCT1_XENTR
ATEEPFQPLAGDDIRVPIPPTPQAGDPSEEEDAGNAEKSALGSLGSGGSSGRGREQGMGSEEGEQVPYPALAPTVFFCLSQTTRPRNWCLRLVCNPYPLHRYRVPISHLEGSLSSHAG